MKVKIVNRSAWPAPAYATIQSAGMDLKANIEEPVTIAPLQRVMVPTGLSIALPEGTEAQIRPRSGLVNLSDTPFIVNPGERIAQMVIARYEHVEWDEVETIDGTDRGEGGFGSTGR